MEVEVITRPDDPGNPGVPLRPNSWQTPNGMEATMDAHVTDIAIHLDSTLPERELSRLEEAVRREPNVVTACLSPEDPHILLVTYDRDGVSSEELVKRLRERGVHASAFGL